MFSNISSNDKMQAKYLTTFGKNFFVPNERNKD